MIQAIPLVTSSLAAPWPSPLLVNRKSSFCLLHELLDLGEIVLVRACSDMHTSPLVRGL